jgi:hypothetical protein
VCPTSDGERCDFGGAHWLLFANEPGGSDNQLDAADQLLRRWSLPPGVSVSGTRGYAAFQPRPGAAATVTFQFAHRLAPEFSRQIVVSQTGRPRLAPPR